jgi:2-polyprenyl-3-methyl-5-hydroxy-6-metoxy-1,4-benzoquinol methylase
MGDVPGTKGYERSAQRFVEISQSLDFHIVCSEFVPFLPNAPARVLDVGAGAGQNAAALADKGFDVVAVEPMGDFLNAAMAEYADKPVTWMQDALPMLGRVQASQERFDMVLVEAVWHHLNPEDQKIAFNELVSLLSPKGRLAMSLRSGPAGLGAHVFPTDACKTVQLAVSHGLNCILHKDRLPSLLPGKATVTWSRFVFEKE